LILSESITEMESTMCAKTQQARVVFCFGSDRGPRRGSFELIVPTVGMLCRKEMIRLAARTGCNFALVTVQKRANSSTVWRMAVLNSLILQYLPAMNPSAYRFRGPGVVSLPAFVRL